MTAARAVGGTVVDQHDFVRVARITVCSKHASSTRSKSSADG